LPLPKKGCPNIKTLFSFLYVTVPMAATLASPVTRGIATASPGESSLSLYFFSPPPPSIILK